MEIYSFRHVNFTYPEGRKPALCDVTFSVKPGEFLIICGPSGCGKSTLLRHLKSCLTPTGLFSGEICFDGVPLGKVSARDQAQKIGFVLQSPENQVVTDKVWHELAFGLESLGYDTPTIRRSVAEVAAFFGIENWFYKNVSELSGGQKQLLSLASVMAMQPSVLVLDEPTAQLDPIAAADFLSLLGKINRELGTTILLTEHRLEEAFPLATRVIVLEQGRIVCDDVPQAVGLRLREMGSGMFLAMPTAMRVWAAVRTDLPCPLTVRDGSEFLDARAKEQPLLPLPEKREAPRSDELVVDAVELWFRYVPDGPDVLKAFSLKLHRGEFYAMLGGNGVGKTTSLRVISGLRKPYRGQLKRRGRLGHLPQNPQTLFVKRTVREDLYEVFRGESVDQIERDARVARVVTLCSLADFLDRHPYDLSGGEQQRAALAKVLLTRPDVLLLDEPTKGFDAEFKVTFAAILRKLAAQGVAILMVSHDVSFCAEYAHRCGLYFDGSIVAQGEPRAFFSGNSFYTTPANRMARHHVKDAVTVNDVISMCGGEVEKERDFEPEPQPLPEIPEEAANYKPKPLPIWRKITAAISALLALAVFFYATGVTDLSSIIGQGGVTELGRAQIPIYLLLLGALVAFALSVGRRSAPSQMEQVPANKRVLGKRTVAASVLILLCIPLTIFVGVVYLGGRYYNAISLLVLLQCMLPFFLVFEGRKPKARELVTIAVLCALGVAGRCAFFMLPNFKPVMALTILAGVAFGGETGFMVGAVTMLTSNVMFGQGPWTPWQMFAMGIVGFLACVLFRKGLLRRNTLSLCVFGAFSAVLIYGGIMDFASAAMVSAENLSWSLVLAYLVSGFPVNLVHGAATVIFLWLLGQPMLEKLDRIKVKYGLVE